jgi:hypothetical protein
MNRGIAFFTIIPYGVKMWWIKNIIITLFVLSVGMTYGESLFGPDIFGLGRFVDKETKPLYIVKDSDIQMSFRTSKDKYQELIALSVTSSFGTVGPILFSSAFYPFTPQYCILKELLVIIGGQTLIIIDYKAGLYHIIPVRATLMFVYEDKVYLESSDRWGQGYDLTLNKRIAIYHSRDRPYNPNNAIAGKKIEVGGRITEQRDAWKKLSLE